MCEGTISVHAEYLSVTIRPSKHLGGANSSKLL